LSARTEERGRNEILAIEHTPAEALKQMSLASINVQVPHLDLRIRPRQTFYALEDVNVVILVGEQQ
jgi:hypothetical protein